jgi:hypothetical protein
MQGFKVKIGSLRLTDRLAKEKISNPIQQIISDKSSVIRLADKYYFILEVKWRIFDVYCQDHILYWNLFLKAGVDGMIKYVGTTKAQNYKLCLELSDYEFPYGLDHADHNACCMNCFSLCVQLVTKQLDKTELDDSQSMFEVCIPGKRSQIKQIIYDFELL